MSKDIKYTGIFEDISAFEVGSGIAGLVAFNVYSTKIIEEINKVYPITSFCTTYGLIVAVYFLLPVAVVLAFVFTVNSSNGFAKLVLDRKPRAWPSILQVQGSLLIGMTVAAFLFLAAAFGDMTWALMWKAPCCRDNILLLLGLVYVATTFLQGRYLRNDDFIAAHRRNPVIFPMAERQYLLISLLLIGFFCALLTVKRNDGKDIQDNNQEASLSAPSDSWEEEAADRLITKYYSDDRVLEDLYAMDTTLRRQKTYAGEVETQTSKSPLSYRVHVRMQECGKDLGTSLPQQVGYGDFKSSAYYRELVGAQWKVDSLIGVRCFETHPSESINAAKYLHFVHNKVIRPLIAYLLFDSIYFGIVLLFLLALLAASVWYLAYMARMSEMVNAEDGEVALNEFTEVNFSRVLLYVIIVLAVPLFKPFESSALSLSEPFLGSNNAGKSGGGGGNGGAQDWERPIIVTPCCQSLNYDSLRQIIQVEVGDKINSVDTHIKEQKVSLRKLELKTGAISR